MTFQSLGLCAPILAALKEQGYEAPSPIQEQAIPPALAGRDVLGCAQTGTGKTCAFASPILQRLSAARTPDHRLRALILTPTRELAIQIGESFAAYGAHLSLRHTVIFGGVGQNPQVEALGRGVDILVATPGRLMDLYQQGFVRLEDLEIFVLDEADRMLDMGFIKDVTHILKQIPHRRNLGLFSATISREVMDISWVYQRDPVEIVVRPVQENRPKISQYRLKVDMGGKVDLLAAILEREHLDRVIVFCNTKNTTDRITGLLRMRGIAAQCIHGDLGQKVREKVLSFFRAGQLRVLVATDVAARGLDIDDVDAVFNYDVPDENEYYIHRIGRTGRARRHGVAYSLVSSITEGIRLDDIRKNTGNEIRTVKLDAHGELTDVEKQ